MKKSGKSSVSRGLVVKNPTLTHPLAETDLITVQLEWDDRERLWVSTVPELNQLSTFGATQEEALDKTAEAMLLLFDTADEYGDRLGISKARRVQLRELLTPVIGR